GEIVFSGTENAVSFDVLISNLFDTAYAPLYIVDKNGYHVTPILELRYKAPSVSELLLVPPTPTFRKVDTLQYPTILIGNKVCSTIVYINTAAKGTTPFTIADVHLKTGTDYTLSTTPALPVALKGGDT